MKRLLPALLLVSALASAAGPKRAPSPPGRLDLASATVVDLTHPFDDRTIYWPTSPSAFELKKLSYQKTPGGWFYASNAFCTPEHGGTHMDAPIHFAEGKATVDQVPVRQLVARAAVIDVSAKAEADADYRLTPQDVLAWETKYGKIREGTIVLLRTGWSKRWPDKKRYLGDDTPGDASRLHFPSYGKEAAELLVNERKVAGIGVDTASIDHGASTDFLVHRLAMEKDVFGLENLTNLEELPAAGAWIVALPMKIAGGSGGPLRAVALIAK